MSWSITLEVVDCGSPTTLLGGAQVSLANTVLGSTDGNGRFTASVDDSITLAIFKITKTDYVNKNAKFEKAVHAGTIQQVCLDNPGTIPDGQDPNVPGESGGQEFDGGCFIVTAVTGSAESIEVVRLRQLRDRVSGTTRLGGRLIEAIYREYVQFSPAIAADLRQDSSMCEVTRQIVVRPLFEWYTFAGMLALDHLDSRSASRAAQHAVDVCSPDVAAAVVPLLEALLVGTPLPDDAPAMLCDVASRLGRLPFAAWAILDPLLRHWRAAAERRDLIDEVAAWLATAPLDALTPDGEGTFLDAELSVLAEYFAFRPAMRGHLGERLLAAWPGTAGALARSGFITERVTRPAT